jgi:hypothetical protein
MGISYDPTDFWLLRDTPLTDSELARLLGSRPDRELTSFQSDRALSTQPANPATDGMDRWEGPAVTDDVLVELSNEGIHLAEGGEVARGLENSIESMVGGWVHKG